MNTEHAELYGRISAFHIDEPGTIFTYVGRLAKENGWSRSYAERVIDEYKKFAFLAVVAGHPVSPSEQVDQAWHLHLTYTRSYWDQFCPDVLGIRLHHEPSKGGSVERGTLVGWYTQTLASYRRFFTEEPPADIWPDAEKRFAEGLYYRRVNTKRNWIVPKRPLKWLAAGALWLLPGLFAVAGCVSGNVGVSTVVSPPIGAARLPDLFNMHGARFLGVFAVAFVIAVGIAAVIRWYMRRKTEEPFPEPVHLDPYEVAYLAGGGDVAINAALASLASRHMLLLDAEKRRVSRPNSGLSGPLHPLEEAVFDAVHTDLGASIDELHRGWPPVIEIADRLKSLGLIVSGERELLGRVLPVLVVLSVPLFGVVKILVGLSRDKPVGYLVIGCIIGAIIAFAAFGRPLLRSWEGDQVLERMKAEKAHLRADGEAGRIELVGPALALAFGLFGVGVLEGGPHAELRTALKPQTASGGWGEYVGGCGGGGGGCGGGCGGCGG